jgi:aminopeptidase-like protein
MTEEQLYRLMADLFPICRSLTGDGVRATLDRIGREIELSRTAVPTGTPVLGWQIPEEWNLQRARLVAPDGTVVADTADRYLHVVGYSEPIRGEFPLDQLQERLHSLPDRPALVPYRTSYYRRTWGFCLPDEVRAGLEPGRYTVDIDATLGPGELTWGEHVVPGRRRDEVLVSTHVCHPDLANDNVTGMAAAVSLAQWAAAETREFSYRFLFVPATVGTVAWLHRSREPINLIRHGLVLTGLGDAGPLTYKRSRRENAPIDRLMSHLADADLRWSPYGYDERQFCSPGFDLPVGRLTRAPHATYPEYHTSADDLSFVSAARVQAAIDLVLTAFDAIEAGLMPRNLAPYGEPQLGSYGLFRSLGGELRDDSPELAALWLLSLGDGEHDLVHVAERSGLPLPAVVAAVRRLRDVGLLG